MHNQPKIVTLISANGEWRIVSEYFSQVPQQSTPYGAWLETTIDGQPVVFLHGGWGKISAAATAQYAIDRWQPELLVNLGTCGGLAGCIQRGEVLLVEETLVYDIFEQMGDPEEALAFYSTRFDLSWLREPLPHPVRRGRLLSADRDIMAADVPMLKERFCAAAADWESGAIAWVASRNAARCLILRGVSDLVDQSGGEAYGNIDVFHSGTRQIMTALLDALPAWLNCARP